MKGAAQAAAVTCEPMTAATVAQAREILRVFLANDEHYRASSVAYGNGGAEALDRALALFVARPELGFVWLAWAVEGARRTAAGACVVCRAISTSRGGVVAKLDDVAVRDGWQGRGVGSAMIEALAVRLLAEGTTRIDTACHRDNAGARRFYARLGFLPLDEERIARLLHD